MNTVSRKPHFGHPTRHFISFETSGGAQPFPNAHHYECMSMRCKWQGSIVRWTQSGSATWHSWMGCRGLSGGKARSIHKDPLKDCRLGTRLALVLLPFHGMSGGGCCLVLTEWRDYPGRIGERRFIITMLYFLHSADGYYVRFFTYTTVLCDLCDSHSRDCDCLLPWLIWYKWIGIEMWLQRFSFYWPKEWLTSTVIKYIFTK